MYAWQWKGEWGSDEIAMFLTLPWKMKSLTWQNPRSIVQPSYTKQKHFKCTHFWITGDEIGVPVYIKTMQSCSSTFDTSSQSFQRQDDQEASACNFMFPLRSRRNAIHRNSSHLSPSEHVFLLGKGARSSGWCVLHTRKWRHPCTLILILEFSFKFISIEKNWNGYRFANFLLK
jgi:hypothetical protein